MGTAEHPRCRPSPESRSPEQLRQRLGTSPRPGPGATLRTDRSTATEATENTGESDASEASVLLGELAEAVVDSPAVLVEEVGRPAYDLSAETLSGLVDLSIDLRLVVGGNRTCV